MQEKPAAIEIGEQQARIAAICRELKVRHGQCSQSAFQSGFIQRGSLAIPKITEFKYTCYPAHIIQHVTMTFS